MSTTETIADTTTTTIQASGMSCGKCAARVKAAVGAVAGVTDVAVDLAAQRVTVKSSPQTSAAELGKAVRRAGYDVLSVASS